MADTEKLPPEGLDPWRKTMREERFAQRKAMSVTDLQEAGRNIASHLEALLRESGPWSGMKVLSGYWPIRGEPDLRPLLKKLHGEGVTIVLPEVVIPHTPLVFRLWTPETRMKRGFWNIPVPPDDAPQFDPDVLIAPLVGWTSDGYRLGYGGGYFDRTQAALIAAGRDPVAIGIGFAEARLDTIHAQPYDIPMRAIVTENGRVTG